MAELHAKLNALGVFAGDGEYDESTPKPELIALTLKAMPPIPQPPPLARASSLVLCRVCHIQNCLIFFFNFK